MSLFGVHLHFSQMLSPSQTVISSHKSTHFPKCFYFPNRSSHFQNTPNFNMFHNFPHFPKMFSISKYALAVSKWIPLLTNTLIKSPNLPQMASLKMSWWTVKSKIVLDYNNTTSTYLSDNAFSENATWVVRNSKVRVYYFWQLEAKQEHDSVFFPLSFHCTHERPFVQCLIPQTSRLRLYSCFVSKCRQSRNSWTMK